MIYGELYVRGNGNLPRLQGFEIILEAYQSRTEAKGYSVSTGADFRRSIDIDMHIDLELKAPMNIPFEFELPRDMGFTDCGQHWALEVSFDLPNGSKDSIYRPFQVLPPEILQEIINAVSSTLGFKENLHMRQWRDDSLRGRFYLEAGDAFRKELDGLTLEIHELENHDVKGRFIFDLQEHSLMDYIYALTGRDKVPMPFYLSKKELYLGDGSINIEWISEYFLEAIRRCLESSREKRK